jgi:4-amino-4-deoxy-L-arabinose transferase-like glycosyltransferase
VGLAPGSVRHPSPDYVDFYRPVAERIAHGDGISLPDGRFADRYPPGFPLFIAPAIGIADSRGANPDAAVSCLLIVTAAGTTVLLFELFRRHFGTRSALLGTALWITYPLALVLNTTRSSEIPFMLFVYAALLVATICTQRPDPAYRLALLVGAFVGLAALVRPAGILFVVVIAAFWWVALKGTVKTKALLIATLVAANLVVIAPWELYSRSRTGGFIPLSTSGPATLLHGLTLGADPAEPHDVDLPPAALEVTRDFFAHRSSLGSVGSVATYAVEELRRHPAGMAELLIAKAGQSWYASDSRRHDTPILIMQLGYLALIGAGLWLAFRRRIGRIAILLVLAAAYFWMTDIGVLSIVRYMMPGLGLLMGFAGIASETILERLSVIDAVD